MSVHMFCRYSFTSDGMAESLLQPPSSINTALATTDRYIVHPQLTGAEYSTIIALTLHFLILSVFPTVGWEFF